jgi:Papain family cysteine protease
MAKRESKKRAKRRTAARGRPAAASSSSTKVSFQDRALDVRPDKLDFRDLDFRPALRSLPGRYPLQKDVEALLPAYVEAGLILDQGQEGACTGFGLACVANYLLWLRYRRLGTVAFEQVSPRMIYELARKYDEWPGEDYEGSSCRGALKGWHKHGVCSRTLWPYDFDAKGKPVFERPGEGWELDATARPLGVYYRVNRESVVDMQAAIAEIGAVYVSCTVHDGWDGLVHSRPTAPPRSHADVPLIGPMKNAKSVGGHAFALVGYDERGFIVQNSWGRVWGASGFGCLPYEDWIEHGTDVWAAALGVPTTPSKARLAAARWPVPSGDDLRSRARAARSPNNPRDDPWPIDHEFDHKPYEPLSTNDAYRRTLVSGNDGELLVKDMTQHSVHGVEDYAEDIVLRQPLAWFKARPKGPARLAIYAHGGLNSESGSIARIRVLAPYFLANGVYPLFLTWRTGAGETVSSAVSDWLPKIPGFKEERAGGFLEWAKEKFSEEKDSAIEAFGRTFGRGIWSEMRENAERSMAQSHGLDLLAQNLATLRDELAKSGRPLKMHLVGHSAGSILLGHLLERLQGDLPAEAPPAETVSLYAAACSVRFAVERYIRAAQAKLLSPDRLWLYCLSDPRERGDGLPSPSVPAYGKSLLYLVSRALDDVKKMPLLGFERAAFPGFERAEDKKTLEQWDEGELPFLVEWQKFWKARGDRLGRITTAPSVRNTRVGGMIPATHGSFDNNIAVLTETIERIAGAKLVKPMEWLDY